MNTIKSLFVNTGLSMKSLGEISIYTNDPMRSIFANDKLLYLEVTQYNYNYVEVRKYHAFFNITSNGRVFVNVNYDDDCEFGKIVSCRVSTHEGEGIILNQSYNGRRFLEQDPKNIEYKIVYDISRRQKSKNEYDMDRLMQDKAEMERLNKEFKENLETPLKVVATTVGIIGAIGLAAFAISALFDKRK